MKVMLTDICRPKQWKTIAVSDLNENGYWVYGANGIIGQYKNYNHEESVIMITCRGATCGEINISKPKSWINGNAMCLDNLSKQVMIKYLYYCLKAFNFKQIISGSAQPQITLMGSKKIIVEIIPLKAQAEIIQKLDFIEKLIYLKRQQLNKMDDLVKSRFIEMFINRNYPIRRLSDACNKITDGTHETPNYLSDGVTFISAKNIIDGKINLDDVKYISNDEYHEIQKRCALSLGDILLTKSGTLGTCAIVATEQQLGLFESLAVVKYDRNIFNSQFLCEQLRSDNVQNQFKNGTKGVAIKHLHLNVIGDTNVIIPPMPKQNQFADFVQQVDKSKVVSIHCLKWL